MGKKFIELYSKISINDDPLTIRTWDRDYQKTFLPTARSVDTPDIIGLSNSEKRNLEKNQYDMLYFKQLFHQNSVNDDIRKKIKLKCAYRDQYQKCVRTRKSISELRRNANLREFHLKEKEQLNTLQNSFKNEEPRLELIKFDSPTMISSPNPQLATPSSSLETVLVPSQRMLDLEKPKSRIYLNEKFHPEEISPLLSFDSSYNPRKIQSDLHKRFSRFDINLRDDKMSIAVEVGDSFDECTEYNSFIADKGHSTDALYIKDDPKNCLQYIITSDIHLCFNPTIVFGRNCAPRINLEDKSSVIFAIACNYLAFGYSYIFPYSTWNEDIIEEILNKAKGLHDISLEYKYVSGTNDFDIYPHFNKDDTRISLEVSSTNYEGKLNSDSISNILKSLIVYLFGHKACLFLCKDVVLLVCQNSSSYVVFDPNGRLSNGERNDEEGKASLMIINSIDHVVHIIINLSGLIESDEYKIYEIRLLKFCRKEKVDDLNLYKITKLRNYHVRDKYHTIIRGSHGLDIPSVSRQRFNPSVLICYVALVYAKINPCQNWTGKIIDYLIKCTLKLFINYITEMQLTEISPDNLPNIIRLGSYRAELTVNTFYKTGHLYECISFRTSSLTSGICTFFKNEHCGLLEVENTTLGIWYDSMHYYLFDPFRRSLLPRSHDSKDDDDDGVPSLHIHETLKSLCRAVSAIIFSMPNSKNFFIHAVNIINLDNASVKTNPTRKFICHQLEIEFPLKFGDYLEKDIPKILSPKTDINSKNYVPLRCLSVLSVSPCEKCSETIKKSLRKRVEHLKDQRASVNMRPSQQLPDFDSYEVFKSVLDDIIGNICDQLFPRSEEGTSHGEKIIKAKKVLLRSDRDYLEFKKKKLLHGHGEKDILNKNEILKEDLKAENPNSQTLFDGTSAIFSTRKLLSSTDSKTLIIGGLSAIMAIVLSKRYNIATWNYELIDYIVDAAELMQNSLQLTSNIIREILERDFPILGIGSKKYRISIEKMQTCIFRNLENILKMCLQQVDRLVIFSNSFSCTLFRRRPFFYLFVGYPCDLVGFRTADTETNGNACLLRFLNLGNVIQRIEFNRNVGNADIWNDDQQFLILYINEHTIKTISTDRFEFQAMSMSDEDKLYQNMIKEKEDEKKKLTDKLYAIDGEIHSEVKRIEDFKIEKSGDKKVKSAAKEEYGKGEDQKEDIDANVMEKVEKEGIESSQTKHIRGIKLAQETQPLYSVHKTTVHKDFGYKLSKEDCLFKIQGNTALENRALGTNSTVRACYFSSIYAILHAICNPVHIWDSNKVDLVIASGKKLYKRIEEKRTACFRQIENLLVDKYNFKVLAKVYEIIETNGKIPLDAAILKIIENKNYFMIQFINGTFAVYKDDCYHLFDSYPSLEVMMNSSNAGGPPENIRKCTINTEMISDKNTASWIVFENLNSMLKYIEKRTNWPESKFRFKFHIIQILSYKNAPTKIRIVNKLTRTPKMKNAENVISEITLKVEKIEWLDNISTGGVPWSRLISVNSHKQKRGMVYSKVKEFDIETKKQLYSLWGDIHPLAACFRETKGKQYLAINVIACCMANVFRISEWNCVVIDNIVKHGDDYFRQSVRDIAQSDYEISLEDLNITYIMDPFKFTIHIESVVFGCLYNKKQNEFCLFKALNYFFQTNRYGIIQSFGKSLAFGKSNRGYFMFDCQSNGAPLFADHQGSAYILDCNDLKILLYCIVVTLNMPYYNVKFVLHKVDLNIEILSKNNGKLNENQKDIIKDNNIDD